MENDSIKNDIEIDLNTAGRHYQKFKLEFFSKFSTIAYTLFAGVLIGNIWDLNSKVSNIVGQSEKQSQYIIKVDEYRESLLKCNNEIYRLKKIIDCLNSNNKGGCDGL
jgi:hypothetical protein